MTNTEKFILKGEETKDAVLTILAVLDGKSYKFSNAALNAAKMFLNEESHFKLENAVQKRSLRKMRRSLITRLNRL